MSGSASLLIDVGGQSVLGLVVDAQARIRHESRRKLGTREEGERVEQDAEELVEAVQAVVDEALAETDAAQASAVTRAAMAVQRGSIVCWDRQTGAALSPVLSWRDRRSLPRLEGLREQAEAIRQRTGLRFSPYAGAPKIAWCLSELPKVRAAAEQGRLACGPLGSFLLARLVENRPARVDHTLAQRSLLWSREDFDWNPWLLARFDLPLNILPRVVPSHSAHGRLRDQRSDISLDLLIGDQNCLPFIDGQPDPETLYINLGTGAFLLRPMTEPVDDPRFQCTLLDECNGGLWAMEGSVHGAASALNWLKRQHGVDLPHDRWRTLRQDVPTPPLFLNSIDGLGSPWWQPGPEPAFVAVDEAETRPPEALLLAVLESIAFLIRANVDAMTETVGEPRRVVVSGGLSQSDTLSSLIADVLGRNVQRLTSVEGTALGLWCRLNGRELTASHFSMATSDGDSALNLRYLVWLQHIKETTENQISPRDSFEKPGPFIQK